jgi:hypothetical protein
MSFHRILTHAPQILRIGLMLSAIAAMVLGGSAGGYWN